MIELDNDLICYKIIELTTDEGKLKFFLEKHSTKEGTWGKLLLHTGKINFIFLNGDGKEIFHQELNAGYPEIIIPPASWHKITALSDHFSATIQFYCKSHRYFAKKYNIMNVHSDVLYAYETYLKRYGKMRILDVGCGSGRNLLFLGLKGHQVTGIDINEKSLQQMKEISQQERSLELDTIIHDLQQPLDLKEKFYNLIISTITLQFLPENCIFPLLLKLQSSTLANGFHLLVFPIEAKQFSLPSTFKFLAKSNQIYHFYQDCGWSILDYKETTGQLHKLDETGQPLQGMFGFLLAQKTVFSPPEASKEV